MTITCHRWAITTLSCLIVAMLAIAGLVWFAGSEIASPARRPLMDYHREILDAPARYGLRIDHFTASDGTPTLICTPCGHAAERGQLLRNQLTSRGWQLAEFGTIRGTLLLTHGRKGRKEDYLAIAERLCACGFRCVIPDLPAHGDHPQAIATYGVREATLPARVLAEAASQFGFSPQPAGLLGLSMGGSVAIHAADQPDATWKTMVVIASFDDFPEVIKTQAATYVGTTCAPALAKSTAWIYQKKSGLPLAAIQPWQHASQIHIPTLIAHGTADDVVPIANGRHLFDALPSTTVKKWVSIPDADHNHVLVTNYPIYAEIADWLLQYLK